MTGNNMSLPLDLAAAVGAVRSLYDGSLPPEVQARTLRHVDRLFPARAVACGDRSWPLVTSHLPWPDIRFTVPGRTLGLVDYLTLNRVSGLLVIHNGQVRLEHYGLGGTAPNRSTWVPFAPSAYSASSCTSTPGTSW